MKINIKNIKVRNICATLFISLFLSCNNGMEDLEKKNQFLSSLANLGNDFLSIFTSFGDSLGGVLAFDKTTTKCKVGDYFKKVKETVEGIKGKLNTIVENMKKEGNPNLSGTETAVNNLVTNTLDKIIKGAETVSEALKGVDASELIGNVAPGGASGNAKGAAGDGVNSLVNGIKSIVGVVLKDRGDPIAGDNKKAETLEARNGTDGEAGKLFSTDNAGAAADNAKKAAADAATKAVGAVTGADILQAMIKDNGDAAALAKSKSNNAQINNGLDNKNDAIIAGAIVLRAMAKGGKFANTSHSATLEAVDVVKGAAVSAVTKVLDTLTMAIRKTIDKGLKTVKEAMNISSEAAPIISEAVTVVK
ncbi:variable large family protein (plasmid) [Borrelia coriaceae]|uniref:Variable large protein n=1 Tax=Borrelia coriaceae ATCC 43381 TaxID=1408429 RepID=W5T2C2_9SPIR|nr:variable large family protein [Borrelia coriaceae]AHH11461.1 Variable outer membrane protein [Borrelia coriaceae ATCC 43381]UPA17291.1 variable large family protein [Borrelia coriaceae]